MNKSSNKANRQEKGRAAKYTRSAQRSPADSVAHKGAEVTALD